MSVNICTQPKIPRRPVYKYNCGVCASLSLSPSLCSAPFSVVLCFTNSSHFDLLDLSSQPLQPSETTELCLGSLSLRCILETPPGNKLTQSQGSLCFFFLRSQACIVCQPVSERHCFMYFVQFFSFWGRRVPVSPVFKWKSLTSFLGTLHIDCRFLSLKKLCHFRHGFWIVKKQICI